MKQVTHLIVGLGKGGAENMLYQIVSHKSDSDVKYRVVSLGASSYYEDAIAKCGVEVDVLNLRERPVSTFFRLVKILKKTDVLCCWMYHANYLGYIAGKLAKVKRIIWNIRHSELGKEYNSSRTLKINKWCAKKSRKVDCVAYNGNKARQAHEEIGYCKENAVVLDNGVDMREFKRVDNAKESLCEELGIDNDKQIVLSVTKNHPIKDIPNFICAFSNVCEDYPNAVAVLCGFEVDKENKELVDLCEQKGLIIDKNVFLLGLRHDIPILLSACDVYVLHSAGEAFPNTLIQAMACGCVCVTTDVGDARKILGLDELVSPTKNSVDLSKKISECLSLDEKKIEEIKLSNQTRISENYNIDNIVKNYEQTILRK